MTTICKSTGKVCDPTSKVCENSGKQMVTINRMCGNLISVEEGHYYRAKKPLRCLDGGFNDRVILWISEDKTKVQYDSPTVGNGRHYPTVTMEKFLKWVGREITKEEYLNTSAQ